MSEGMNKVLLLGNLGGDPELRYTATGTAVLNLRLATNEVWVDKEGKKQDRTEWHNVVIFGPRAEALSKFLGKGSGVLVEGGLRTQSYEGKDGVKRTKTEVWAKDIVLMPSGRRPAAPPPGIGVDDLLGNAAIKNGKAGAGAADDTGDEIPY